MPGIVEHFVQYVAHADAGLHVAVGVDDLVLVDEAVVDQPLAVVAHVLARLAARPGLVGRPRRALADVVDSTHIRRQAVSHRPLADDVGVDELPT